MWFKQPWSTRWKTFALLPTSNDNIVHSHPAIIQRLATHSRNSEFHQIHTKITETVSHFHDIASEKQYFRIISRLKYLEAITLTEYTAIYLIRKISFCAYFCRGWKNRETTLRIRIFQKISLQINLFVFICLAIHNRQRNENDWEAIMAKMVGWRKMNQNRQKIREIRKRNEQISCTTQHTVHAARLENIRKWFNRNDLFFSEFIKSFLVIIIMNVL